ncbi:hypothetical protein [Anaerostipes sp.]|uniref:hypothetical protein n=1 Tax=Anaerostipes sp. TaxID=1872530 RepID=UPI0025C724C4|nr:hypothetical protein [Anaerostipes sp.]MBS7008666.1 hypothetical protein [Anaerostipes sp.]
MKVQKKQLLLAAGIVWGLAGINILRIGIIAYKQNWSILNGFISALVFAVFQIMVFGKLVRKHTARIINYEEEKQFLFKFFDLKSFCIMGFMMTFGIGIRMSGIWPESWIAVFYTGLGTALFLAGMAFAAQYIKIQNGARNCAQAKNRQERRKECRQ